jgi:hypothetical protein
VLALLTEEDLDAVFARRREWGADRHDEMWSGIPHLHPVGGHAALQQAVALLMRPGGEARGLVPVLGAYEPRGTEDRREPSDASHPVRGDQASTAALAVEITTGERDLRRRLPAIAADRVSEVVVVDPVEHTVGWFALSGGEYAPIEMSRLVDLGRAQLTDRIDWRSSEQDNTSASSPGRREDPG